MYMFQLSSGDGGLFNPLDAELNPICHLLALLGSHHIFHVSGLMVKVTNLGFYTTTIEVLFNGYSSWFNCL